MRGVTVQTTPGSQETLTFVVRLWREADAAGQHHWRGRVERVGTGEVRYVERIAGVTEAIEHWVTKEGDDPRRP